MNTKINPRLRLAQFQKTSGAPWYSWVILLAMIAAWFAAIAFFAIHDWQRAVACLMLSVSIWVVLKAVS